MKKTYAYFLALFLILIFSSILLYLTSKTNPEIAAVNQDSLLVSSACKLEYGFPVDSFEIIKGIISKNKFLGDIMSEFSVSDKITGKIQVAAQGIFDFRKIKAGNIFAFLKSKDPKNETQYFVYEHSPIEYYIVELTDSVTIEKREKAIETHHKTTSGVINSSLWNSVAEQEINPMLATRLSEIFAWSIDFFGLQRGDAFKIMYDEQYVDSISVGIGEIHGAWFKHAGKEFTAIPFYQDNEVEFFDAEGKSLRKAFLKAPLRFSRISSRFTGARFHPLLKRITTHYGVDYAAPSGTPVHAIGDGMIISAGWSGGGGNMIKIRHNSVYSTAYMHLRGFGPGIRSGSYVRQGEVIGYVGSTGLSTGPHLDFRVWRNNAPINPLTMESPSVEPVKTEKMGAFMEIRNTVLSQLTNLKLPGVPDSEERIYYTLKGKCADSDAF
jgi:murein DD-endopeptidase MepM/ murein hydrolase activator NlpD